MKQKVTKIGFIVLSISILAVFFSCNNGGSIPPEEGGGDTTPTSFPRPLPPTGTVTRTNPKLVNYFHMNLSDGDVPLKAERLAQWDVIILNPDDVAEQNISLTRIRQIHPDIVILAWVPFGQAPESHRGIGTGLPAATDPDHWYAQMVSGDLCVASWGGYIMNPYKDNFAWGEYAADYVKTNYIDNGLYDGIMFDCLSNFIILWASSDNPPTFDVDGDGDFDDDDKTKYAEGVYHMIEKLRTLCPSAIITGNGGVPWTDQELFKYCNGNMHENSLGNEFGTHLWHGLYGANPAGCLGFWEGYEKCKNSQNPNNLRRFHFLSVDVRMDRTQQEAEDLQTLTPDDYRRFRLGLTTSMLNDIGYFGFDRGDCLHGQLWWFDEYDAPIGNPTDTYQTGVYGNDQVYSRTFDNGVVIVNNNDFPLTLILNHNHKDVSTGYIGSTVTIPAYDGRIFLRQ